MATSISTTRSQIVPEKDVAFLDFIKLLRNGAPRGRIMEPVDCPKIIASGVDDLKAQWVPTSHSADASVARRVTMDVTGRVMDGNTLRILNNALSSVSGDSGTGTLEGQSENMWSLTCMRKLVKLFAYNLECVYAKIMENDRGPDKVSLHTDSRTNIAMNISSGTLQKGGKQ